MPSKPTKYPNKVKPRFTKQTRTGKTVPDYETEFFYYFMLNAPVDAPLPVHQYDKMVPGRRYSADFAFPEHCLVVEIDGGVWLKGGGYHGRDTDRERGNLLTLNGWRVLRFSSQMLMNDPRQCVDQVYIALGYRSIFSV